MPPKKRKQPNVGFISIVENKKEPKKQKEARPEEECIENVEMVDVETKKKKIVIIYNLTDEEKENKFLYLPNDIVSIPLKRKDGTVVARTTVNLTDFKEKKLDSWSYHLNSGYAKSSNKKRLHEIIMGQKAPKGYKIDHRNRNRLDNTRQNLRIITDALNALNQTKRANTSSRFYGVSIYEQSNGKKWKSQSHWNRQLRGLGTFDFDKELEAAKKYDRFILSVHGIEARETTNTYRFPKEQLLTEIEIQTALKSNPEDYLFKKKSGLPKYINKCRGRFRAQITGKHNISLSKTFDTVEEAVKAIDVKLEEIKKAEELYILSQPIERNAKNEAILTTNQTSGESHDFTVDDGDYYYLYQYSWSYYLNADDSVSITGNVEGVTRSLYDVVWKRHHPGELIPKGLSIDHIDRSHLNVKSSNLRLLNASDQKHNQKHQSISGETGVTPSGNRWKAEITINKHQTYLGTFSTIEEASKAYKTASAIHYPGILIF